jgi:SAM-dependent methyltransferase
MADGSVQRRTYDPDCFDRLVRVEDRHFWFRARTSAIINVIRSAVSMANGSCRILEVGCGTGTLLKALNKEYPRGAVIGLDFFNEGLLWARRRSPCGLVQADALLPPFNRSFDLIGLFDVIEHLDDDIAVLRSVRDVLLPGGIIAITVPAHPGLWSYFDEYSHHRRRYTEGELRAKLKEAGYEVRYMTPYMCILLPLIWSGRKLAGALSRSKHGTSSNLAENDLRITPGVNFLLTGLLLWESFWIGRRWRLPWGASLIAIASRQE